MENDVTYEVLEASVEDSDELVQAMHEEGCPVVLYEEEVQP